MSTAPARMSTKSLTSRCVECRRLLSAHGWYRPPERDDVLRVCPREEASPEVAMLWSDFKEMMGSGTSLEVETQGVSEPVLWYCKGLRRALVALHRDVVHDRDEGAWRLVMLDE